MTVQRNVLCVGLVASVLMGSGCTPPTEHFESVCQLIRRNDVEVNDKGEVSQVDIELEWDPCPGEQFQVVRGGAAFAQCMAKYKLGDLLPVRVRHWWDSRGFYVWDVDLVGDCHRAIEPWSEGSFEKSQECKDHQTFGVHNGFSCNRKPFHDLVDVCPWMARN